MKKVIFILCALFAISLQAQELKLNSETKVFEYDYVKESSNNTEWFINKLKELDYRDVTISEERITAGSFFSKIILSTPIEIQYKIVVDFKEGKYRVTFNKFVLKDQRFGMVPLEDVRSGQKRWIKTINEKLPELISAIESKGKDW